MNEKIKHKKASSFYFEELTEGNLPIEVADLEALVASLINDADELGKQLAESLREEGVH